MTAGRRRWTLAAMPPRGYVGVVVCGTRRAEAWRRTFVRAGIDAVVEETDGEDAARGACRVAVPHRRRVAAGDLVTAVTQGRRRLEGTGSPVHLVVAVVAIVALLATLLVAAR